MDNFDKIFEQACNHEPTDEEISDILNLIDKEYINQDEAITTAYLFGKFTATCD